MSDTSMTKEFSIAVEEFGLAVKDLEKITVNAMKSAFAHFDDRIQLIYGKIKPGYAAAKM